MDLRGHSAIVSGGLGDIGRAIGRTLGGHGANVAVGDRLPAAQAAGFLAELRTLGVKARYDRVDVTDAAAVQRWVRAAEKTLGAVDLIVPNAAVVRTARE